MSSLRDFINNQNNQKKYQENIEKNNFDKIIDKNPEKIENIQENLDKFKNMSQKELMNELFKEAGRMKENGSLNNDSINMLKNTLNPMLTSEQKNMLENILNQIK